MFFYFFDFFYRLSRFHILRRYLLCCLQVVFSSNFSGGGSLGGIFDSQNCCTVAEHEAPFARVLCVSYRDSFCKTAPRSF